MLVRNSAFEGSGDPSPLITPSVRTGNYTFPQRKDYDVALMQIQ